MTTYAFTFARGGSRGLPGKNVKMLGGRPLLAWAIDAAAQVEAIDRHFVSTDDPEIAAVADEYGATLIHRPDALATDRTPEWLAWQHAVAWTQRHVGDFDTFVSVPATTPLRIGADIDAVITRFAQADVDLALAVTPALRNPAYDMVSRAADGEIRLLDLRQAPVSRRQDAPRTFTIAGSVYVTSPTFITANSRLFDGRVAGVEVPRERAIDIDEELDFVLAQALVERRSVVTF